jgi:aryl-alcohol dehydrogenase-like predicted oxidoreductase
MHGCILGSDPQSVMLRIEDRRCEIGGRSGGGSEIESLPFRRYRWQNHWLARTTSRRLRPSAGDCVGVTVNGNSLLARELKRGSTGAIGQRTGGKSSDMIPVSAVPRRVLGRTGLSVSALGFGTAPLGDLFARLDDATSIATVERAFELGINLLDTSPHYGRGLAEHRCGTAIRRVPRQDIVVCTKVGRWMDPFHAPSNASGFVGGQPHRAVVDYSYDGTMRSVEQSLLRLGTDRLDLLLIHDVDVWTHGLEAIEDRFREAMAGAYVALDRLRGEGVVAGIGIGVNEAEMCVRFAQAGSFDTMLLAGRYSLLEQPALAHFLPLAERRASMRWPRGNFWWGCGRWCRTSPMTIGCWVRDWRHC